MYDYKIVNIDIKNQDAASYMQNIVNQMASQGWEYYRVDNIDVLSEPGCFGAILGQKKTNVPYSVATFRKQK